MTSCGDGVVVDWGMAWWRELGAWGMDDVSRDTERTWLAGTEGASTASDGEETPPGYEPPAIVYRAPIEVTAAFCDPVEYGKVEGYCWMGPINS